MAKLSDVELFEVVHRYFGDLPIETQVLMGAIALAESGGETEAVGDNFASGHQSEHSPYRWDLGLFQINSVHGFNRERLLGDAGYNAWCARAIWDRQGFPAWSTFKAQSFRPYVTRMEAAATNFLAPDAPTPVESLLSPPLSKDDAVPLFIQLYGYNQGIIIDPLPRSADGRRSYNIVMP